MNHQITHCFLMAADIFRQAKCHSMAATNTEIFEPPIVSIYLFQHLEEKPGPSKDSTAHIQHFQFQ